MSKRKTQKADALQSVTAAEALYINMLSHLLHLCPSSLTTAVIVHHENAAPLLLGSCCPACARAMVHITAEVVRDPRQEATESESTEHDPARQNVH